VVPSLFHKWFRHFSACSSPYYSFNGAMEKHHSTLWFELTHQETLMNKDQIKGRVEEAKGKVKEATGVLLDDEGMEVEGNIQKNVGKIKKGFGDLKEDIKDKLDD